MSSEGSQNKLMSHWSKIETHIELLMIEALKELCGFALMKSTLAKGWNWPKIRYNKKQTSPRTFVVRLKKGEQANHKLFEIFPEEKTLHLQGISFSLPRSWPPFGGVATLSSNCSVVYSIISFRSNMTFGCDESRWSWRKGLKVFLNVFTPFVQRRRRKFIFLISIRYLLFRKNYEKWFACFGFIKFISKYF